ncbi:MAG: hypothetical protein DRR42_18035 [Gammaproteobacteria bacterium]|nr:MAG: hypothetical protein DRR42_18035 [Gammaproteobacteria bacterium]
MQLVYFSVGGERLICDLDKLAVAVTRLLPKKIVMDNGPELIGKAMFFWFEANERQTTFHPAR